ncbi:hypothetical protein [Streptomyces sp. Wb2n-11]|uniref:hypothetical protein n=1 Tax=Streptomyces sp. Wb2n-11 TaxID=1030533 RepID=UPI000B09098B|nr:hypothetical protein [Streptomyces sp. Wb2n-11]
MTTALERQVAVYRTLPPDQRAAITRLADKETRAALAWAEQQMAIERSPGQWRPRSPEAASGKPATLTSSTWPSFASPLANACGSF